MLDASLCLIEPFIANGVGNMHLKGILYGQGLGKVKEIILLVGM